MVNRCDYYSNCTVLLNMVNKTITLTVLCCYMASRGDYYYSNWLGPYSCKVEVTGPLLHESPEVDQHCIWHVGNVNIMSITTFHLE